MLNVIDAQRVNICLHVKTVMWKNSTSELDKVESAMGVTCKGACVHGFLLCEYLVLETRAVFNQSMGLFCITLFFCAFCFSL